MTVDEALDFIHRGFFGGTKPGLERVRELLGLLGNPEKKLRFIHVTGTNGKGSFCAMTDSILRAAGYPTGLFTSPYVKKFNERMIFRGEPISDEELAALTEEIKPYCERMEEQPTEFELITAMAMLWFSRKKADPVVLEVGMGGRLDATNVIERPIISVVTGVSLDHTAILGPTVAAIAKEKAGIIKPGRPVLWCGDSPEAEEVIRKAAGAAEAPFFTVNRRSAVLHSADLDGILFDYSGFKNLRLPLLGTYQLINAENVITACRVLRREGLRITPKAVRRGLESVVWHARFELLSRDPVFVFDGGHNPEGVDAAVKSIRHYFPDGVYAVTGMLADKDWKYCSERIGSVAKKVFCITPPNPRALDAAALADRYVSLGIPARAFSSIADAVGAALEAAKAAGMPAVCLGSLYIYCDVSNAVSSTAFSSN